MQDDAEGGSRSPGNKCGRARRRKHGKTRSAAAHAPGDASASTERQDAPPSFGKEARGNGDARFPPCSDDGRPMSDDGPRAAVPLEPKRGDEPTGMVRRELARLSGLPPEPHDARLSRSIVYEHVYLAEERQPQRSDIMTAAKALIMHAAWWAAFSARDCFRRDCDGPASMVCSRCHAVRYCSAECLGADWKRRDGTHKNWCKHLRVFNEVSVRSRVPLPNNDAKINGAVRQLLVPFRLDATLRRLLRAYKARGIAAPPLRGYIISTDAPQTEVQVSLIRATACWSTPPDETCLGLLHPRTRSLLATLRSLHRCCRPQIVLLVWSREDASICPCIPLIVPPCSCHDHEACFRAVAASDLPAPPADELMAAFAYNRSQRGYP